MIDGEKRGEGWEDNWETRSKSVRKLGQRKRVGVCQTIGRMGGRGCGYVTKLGLREK